MSSVDHKSEEPSCESCEVMVEAAAQPGIKGLSQFTVGIKYDMIQKEREMFRNKQLSCLTFTLIIGDRLPSFTWGLLNPSWPVFVRVMELLLLKTLENHLEVIHVY